jgi:pimeloyl-ACP methyl ester carboxylesterase
VIPLAASLAPEVAFLIEVGGSQVPAWQQDILRVEEELRAAGAPERDVREAIAFARMRMALIRGMGEFEDLEAAHDWVQERPWFPHVGRCDRELFYSARRMVEFDPGASWKGVRCPVLAIYGQCDTSSPPERNLAILRRGLEAAGNYDVTTRVFPGADHTMLIQESGRPSASSGHAGKEPRRAARDFAPGYLDLMTRWLLDRFGRRPA